MKIFSKIVLIFLLIFTSCKSNKNTVGSNISSISTKKIINNHYSSNFDQKTVNAKINAKYKDEKTSVSFSIKLRLEKDKTIWMSATKFGIPVAKVKITPSRVIYYEKMQRTYFDGDFSLLSKWLGTELDYEKVQNILLGQAVLNLKKGKYNSEIANNLYQLKPKKDIDLFGILFFMNPDNFKVNRQEIRNQEKQQLLSVSYPNYSKIKGEQFPKNIDIRAIDHKKITTINIEYRTVEFNERLTFPFSIPNGYKEISLK
ncbi:MULTISPECIES: DUF4292 domain-containing protein [Flavobacteriaceae]|uniref:DUF4292 domain-containing protein n=2 Tax=Flavobacteriaceae TaxID=49546 RepID=A0A4Y8AS31_9FLAO|nr:MULTISPECIES: DUF4292 domain-containing protein [Flavobacteriaceae]TEW74003.1 DUF4292 domain-containing protein [Gramella jeungdoensis]GGK39539.1 hypothetical protein GCM10007963_04410 [Lutibacter litoralis]